MTRASTDPSPPRPSAGLRRLDHVAVVVEDTERALAYFRDRLGLQVVRSEEIANPAVRLTYLDCGNAFLQLVEPLATGSSVAAHLERHGEGLHHVCFGADDVLSAASVLADPGTPEPTAGTGRGRVSAFVAGEPRHGVRIECTEFRHDEDVEAAAGWLPPGARDNAEHGAVGSAGSERGG